MFTTILLGLGAFGCFTAEALLTAALDEAMIEEKTSKAVEAKFADAFANCEDLAGEVVKAKLDEELDVVIKNQIIKQKLDRETRKMVNEEVEKNISAIIKETVRETLKESQKA